MYNEKSKRTLSHSWEYEITIDEGVCFMATGKIELRYEAKTDSYVVSELGADPTRGRHWNPTGRPAEIFSNYRDALTAYSHLAHLFAPDNIQEQIHKEVERELSKAARDDASN